MIKFEGIDSLERAKEFANIDVYFPRDIKDNSIDSEEETLSYTMLVGFQVNDIGKIAYIDNQTENIMFELEDGTLIPASEELIEDIDVPNKQIKMTIPEGLLDL